MSGSAPRVARRAALGTGVGALIGFAVLAWTALPGASSSTDRPPKILTATATYHEAADKVAFSVEVQRRPRRVMVSHGGVHLVGHRVKHLHYWWQTQNVDAAKKRCYRIRVKARNGHGVSARRMRAGRLGSDGCS
jgi:hypothetical protein